MERKDRTAEEKRQASEQLLYEVTMLEKLGSMLAAQPPDDDVICGNAMLESFSIHARVLIDFFYPVNPRPNDVIANDFLGAPDQWATICPPKSELLDHVEQRVGREVVRMNYDRQEVVPILIGSPFGKIVAELHRIFQRFLKAVPAEFLGPRCAEFKHRDVPYEE